MVEFKSSTRNRSYKKGIDADEGRRRRDDTRVQIRKAKREEGLQKRRAMAAAPAPEMIMAATDASATAPTTAQDTSTAAKKYTANDIPMLLAMLHKPDVTDDQLLEAVRGFRKMLSIEENPPVRNVIDCGAVPIFIQLLSKNDHTKIQFEAAWALTNVASTQYTRTVVEFGAVPHLIHLLLSGNPDVREQSAWCLGNISGDSPDLRDLVLEAGALDPLLQNIANPESNSLLSNCVWALSNFCRGKPQPHISAVSAAIPHLCNLLQAQNNEALADACWALSYMSDGEDSKIQTVMDGGVTPHLVKLLGHSTSGIVTPALRTLGNFVSGSDTQTQAVIDAGVYEQVGSLLENPKRTIRKEACWLLSNIAAGNQEQISSLMRKPQNMGKIVDFVRNAEWEVRKEATWVVSNIASGGKDEHLHCLVELGAIDALCSILEVADSKIILIVLEALDKILKAGQLTRRDYVGAVDECDGLDKIELLQEHQNNEVYEKAIYIIETYFGIDEGGEDENILPSSEGDTFSFGLPTKNEEMSNGAAPQQQQPLQPFNFTYCT